MSSVNPQALAHRKLAEGRCNQSLLSVDKINLISRIVAASLFKFCISGSLQTLYRCLHTFSLRFSLIQKCLIVFAEFCGSLNLLWCIFSDMGEFPYQLLLQHHSFCFLFVVIHLLVLQFLCLCFSTYSVL